jgi:hypothetical protein
MKKSLALLFIACLAIASCKKKGSSAPSIAGTWTLTNISGTQSYNLTSGTGFSATYSYASDSSILTETTTFPGSGAQSVSIYQLKKEQWTFSNSGAYAINEIFINTPGSGNPVDTSVVDGTWAYLGNARSSDSVNLSNGISFILSGITPGDSYTIQSLSNSTLQLSVVYSDTTGGALTASDVVYTFSR